VSASLRKLGLTLHVIASVSWLGAVLGFLALLIPALCSNQPMLVRGACISMDVLARFAILPLCVASLVTGIFQSFVSRWGLVQHYWVVFKLLLNLLSTVVLVGHMRPIAELAGVALQRTLERSEFGQVGVQIAIDASAATVVLLIATVLAIYKPRGVTPYGWREQQNRRAVAAR